MLMAGVGTTFAFGLLACSGGESPPNVEVTGAASGALESIAGLPVPSIEEAPGSIRTVWQGTAAELWLADAFASCSMASATITVGQSINDDAIKAVQTRMASTIAAYPAPKPTSWMNLRTQSAYNAKPISKRLVSAGLVPQLPERYVWTSIGGAGTPPTPGLQAALDAVGVNLCMARALHEQTELGALLLTPAADQRFVHSAIRERAQLAMLHLVDLLATLALPADDSADANAVLLRTWAARPTSKATLDAWGADLADAVRLHVAATQTLADLFARSAAAHDVLPGASDLPSANDFSSGSWRQRGLAALFGGDPTTAGKPGVAAPTGGITRTLDRTQWPTTSEWGSTAAGLWTPGAVRALSLARQNKALSLVLKAGKTTYASSADIDVTASATWLYRDIEAALRTAACASFDANTFTCGTTTGAQVTETLPFDRNPNTTALAPFRMWKQHQLRPIDVSELVLALVDALPSTDAVRGLPIVGNTRLVDLPGQSAKRLVFDSNAYFVQRSPIEIAALYAGMGRHRIPTRLTSSETGGVRVEPLYSGSEGPLEGGRRLGAVPALATVREAIDMFAGGTGPGAESLLRYKDAIVKAIDNAIGGARLAIRPAELGTSTPSGDAVVQPRGQLAGTHVWNVRVTTAQNDAFWTGGTAYAVVAVARTPQAAIWLNDPSSQKAGFTTLDTLLASGSANTTIASLTRATDGSFSTSIDLADDALSVLFVRRLNGRRAVYLPLSGPIAPVVAAANASSPVDALYFAPGGTLGIVATKMSAIRKTDPSLPAFDGFGQLYETLPPRDEEIAAADAPLNAYAERLKATASSSEALARSHLNTVLENIRLDEMGQADLAAAEGRELGLMRGVLNGLCGVAANVAGSLDDLEARSAEAACGVTTMTIDAYASTDGELALACGTAYAGGAPAQRPSLQWGTTVACPANPDADGVTSEEKIRCMLDVVGTAVAFNVPVAKQVACTRYTPGAVSFAPVGGVLNERLVRQRTALQAYGNAVRELELAGAVVAASAKAADVAVETARLQHELAISRKENARRAGLNDLAALTEKVAEAQIAFNGAVEFQAKLTGMDAKEIAKGALAVTSSAGAAASTGAVLGAASGTALGPAGAAIGAVVGAGLGVIGWVLGGPSEEELQAAQNAVDQARKRLENAQAEERRYAEFLGVCLSDPTQAGDGGAPCPFVPDLGTVFDVYNKETEVAEQQKMFAVADRVVALRKATLAIAEKLTAVSAAANALASESAGLQLDVEKAQIGLAQAKLEVLAAQSRVNATFGFTQAFHAADMWTVGGLVDAARRDIVNARRATEFVTMSDLSTITSNLSNVGAPSLWADQVYDYDLSPLRVAGTAIGRPSMTTISETKLQIYLANLGWAATSIRSAQQVTYSPSMMGLTVIPGPAAQMTVRVDDPAGSYDITVRDPVASMWQVECPRASDCAPDGGWCSSANASSFEEVCKKTDPNGAVTIQAPTSIKLAFTLDPWGKFRDTMPTAVLPNLLNGRWSRFAINLTGSDIRDCSAPDAPPDCTSYTNSLLYTLRHAGPYYAFAPSYILKLLPLPSIGTTGRARADGTNFDMFLDDLEGAAMRPLRQSAFWGYPLGGGYELKIYRDEGQQMAKVEKVELLFNATYWQPTNQ